MEGAVNRGRPFRLGAVPNCRSVICISVARYGANTLRQRSQRKDSNVSFGVVKFIIFVFNFIIPLFSECSLFVVSCGVVPGARACACARVFGNVGVRSCVGGPFPFFLLLCFCSLAVLPV